MRIMRVTALTAAALAMTATTLSAAQVATAADFSVTANGVASGGTVADLPASATVQMAVNNLPAGVGLYAFHCLVPPPGASPVPIRCDAGSGTLVYIMAADQAQTTSRPIVANAEFVGKNPNPQTGDTGTTDVNCRVDTCAIYTLGAGRDSTNRAYTKFFATEFAEEPADVAQERAVQVRLRMVRRETQELDAVGVLELVDRGGVRSCHGR